MTTAYLRESSTRHRAHRYLLALVCATWVPAKDIYGEDKQRIKTISVRTIALLEGDQTGLLGYCGGYDEHGETSELTVPRKIWSDEVRYHLTPGGKGRRVRRRYTQREDKHVRIPPSK